MISELGARIRERLEAPVRLHLQIQSWRRLALVTLGGAALAAAGCSGDETPAGGLPAASSGSSGGADDAVSHAALAKRGRSVYLSNCTACHAPDPSQDGSLGPAITGSSLELLGARVLRGEYPPGYTPKRQSKLMIPMPHLERELAALHAYLNPEG